MTHNDHVFWKALATLIHESAITIDRPKGTAHPVFTNFIYPVDYGHIRDTHTTDNAELDIFVGSADKKIVSGIITTVDTRKQIKKLYACTTNEIKTIYQALHTPLNALLARRPDHT